MPILSKRAAGYTRAWLRGPVPTEEVETTIDRAGERVTATLIRPARSKQPLPGWIVLHGMTRLGRAHAQLVRFTRALASSGAVAIVPEVPEWRALSLSPHVATPTVRAGLRGLRDSGWAADRPVGIIGFSFGAPHGIAAASAPDLADEIAGAVGFGGYCDIETTFRFMMTGRSDDSAARVLPDPYGRWVVASNYLAAVPERSDHVDVADALRDLAAYSGDVGAPSWDAVYTPKIAELREGIAPERRAAFDLFALPGGALPDEGLALDIAERLAVAGRATDPLLDPRDCLARVRRPVHVLHGRGDRLISCEEAPRLGAALPDEARASVTITRLFGHSGQDPFPFLRTVQEVPRFFRALTALLAVP